MPVLFLLGATGVVVFMVTASKETRDAIRLPLGIAAGAGVAFMAYGALRKEK